MTTPTARAQSAERNHRAVYSALRRVIKDRALLTEAWDFYQERFVNEPVIVVNDFISALNNAVGLDPNHKRSLTVSLFAALNRDLADLPEVPQNLRQATPASKPALNGHADAAPAPLLVDEGLSHEQIVFRGLVTRFTERATRKDPDAAKELGEMLAEDAALSSMPAAVASALDAWIESGFSAGSCPLQLDVARMKQVVHAMYVAACEAFGPVSTDQLLAAAVTDANGLPQAEMFPPDRFL